MVQPGGIGLDTPRTNIGDATYLTNPNLDFDISQETSFQSPSKDNNNLLSQLRNARRGDSSLRTPRSRTVLTDRRNLPAGLGGGEFTPLLKSATRNSRLQNGKENTTPAVSKRGLQDIPEDFSPLPHLGSSVYGRESGNATYLAGTPAPNIESSSNASTPMAIPPRRTEGPGMLQDGNQMSLREQENVIDKIEKENFGLKLKIHFLEEALRKAGPGFSEAALKENTELKVDKVTMQKELNRYRKTLTAAEKDVEVYRQHLMEMQEKYKRKQHDAGQQEELERLRQGLEEKEEEFMQLKAQETRYDDLEDKVQELESDLREKDRLLDEQQDEVENLKDDLQKNADTISELEQALKRAQRRNIELEEEAQANQELAEAKEMIEDLERNFERLKSEAQDYKEDYQEAIREKERAQSDLQDAKEGFQEAIQEKERAEADLEELQDEMANKSVTTKGLNRQIEEKCNRLQDELEDLKEKHQSLEEEHGNKDREIVKLRDRLDDLKQDNEFAEQKLKEKVELLSTEKQAIARERASLTDKLEKAEEDLQQTEKSRLAIERDQTILISKLERLQTDLQQREDEKNILQIRHDALTSESAGLQRELTRSRSTIDDLEDKLDHEKTLALNNERQVRDEYKAEIDRLRDELDDLQAEIRDKQREYDEASDKWDSQRRNLESQKEKAEEQAFGLKRSIDKLQEAEGVLSGKESKFQQSLQSEISRHQAQEALFNRQIKELNEDLQSRSETLDNLRVELSSVREELRLSQREHKSWAQKVEALEDEVEVLQASLEEETDRSNQEITDAKKESDGLRKQIQSLKKDLVKAESATASAQAEIEAFHGDLRAGEGSNEQLNSRLREVENQLSKIREEKQNLKDQLSTTVTELHSLRRSKAEIEAERDELQSQLQSMNYQDNETFRLDQERVDLRTAKIKLEGEVRRLRDENKSALLAQQTLERELQEELVRASTEEGRLSSEVQDLQRILRGSSEKRELAAAKKTIQQLEARIVEMENQIADTDDAADAHNELSIMRRDLSSARQKEMDYLQREASQKESLRSLKRQIADLERKSHDAEISRLGAASPSPSPRSSFGGSAQKSEIIEVRNQLSIAQQSLKSVRIQLKEVERDAARKLKNVTAEFGVKSEVWESEKDELERALDEELLKREELEAQNKTSEATITRLRKKIERIEQALQAERLNKGEDRTIANERHDLHEMLRESQLQVETLELVVREREATIKSINKAHAKLNDYAGKVQAQRNDLRTKQTSANNQLDHLERKLKESNEAWAAEKRSLVKQVQKATTQVNDASSHRQIAELERKFKEAAEAWEQEKRALTSGVRFANMSVSENGGDMETLKKEIVERESFHMKSQKGLRMQLDWWKARCDREARFRDMGAYAKQYMGIQIQMFEACNKADLELLKTIPGLKSVRKVQPPPKLTLKIVGHMVRSIVRMQNGAAEWAKKTKLKRSLQAAIDHAKEQKKYDEAVAQVERKFAHHQVEQATSEPEPEPEVINKIVLRARPKSASPVKARSVSTPVKKSYQVTVEDDTQTSFSRIMSARRMHQTTVEDVDDTRSSFSRVLSVRRQVMVEDETQSTFSRVMAGRRSSMKNTAFDSSVIERNEFSVTDPMPRYE